MINTDRERAKAVRRLNGLRIFENRTRVLIESIAESFGIDYNEPLLNARKEMEILEREIKEFDELLRAKTAPITIEGIRAVPKVLVRMRYQAGMSQMKLAKRLGISTQLMSKYEKDYANLKLRKIAEIFEVLENARSARNATREEG